jgi:valyl-tRNA synthetase
MKLPDGPYDSKLTEAEILDFWLKNKFYKPEYNPQTDSVQSTDEMKADSREPWSLICPPPNAYGRPHLGNISGYAYQDAMGRYARMQGKKVLMIPGKDHAGLEGEGVFVRDVLEPKKIDKFSMSREEFYSQIWEFNMQNKELALTDEKNVGLSADFDRDIFTLDPRVVDIVLSTFVEMHKEEMIYKGVRIVNWDPKARSVIADNQCIREEREGKLYKIKYNLANNETFEFKRLNDEGEVVSSETRNYIEVATTRPETMFGDTAVAINPQDKRYSNLLGKKVVIPLTNIEIPVISSPRVLTDFGTGCLKITPAHAQDDFIIMNEWNATCEAKGDLKSQISYRNVIGKDLKFTGTVPTKYLGRKYKEALTDILEDLKSTEALVQTDPIAQNILISERTKSIVEPIMSSQWFIDIEKIKQPVIDMVKNGEVKIHPEYMEAKFFNWMENLRDWAISRSLWWGYRMPVWYAGTIEERIDEKGLVETYVELEKERFEILDPTNPSHMRVQIESPGEGWIQEESVLDTWFSSGQWPYATLMVHGLMDTFYPTDVMETGFDILENWVSRMMMFSYFKLKKIPFKNVYLHGLVLGKDNQKMSKSRKNVIPMDEARDQYGTDSLRMVYFYQNSAGASYSLTYDKLKNFKNFCNKLWNASRFVLSNLADSTNSELPVAPKIQLSKEILEHITSLKTQVTDNIEKFQFGLATYNIYHEFWHNFCDIQIEASKKYFNTFKDRETGEVISEPSLEEKSEMEQVLAYTLKQYLKMMHPFMPFITEKIWQSVPHTSADHKSLMYTKW